MSTTLTTATPSTIAVGRPSVQQIGHPEFAAVGETRGDRLLETLPRKRFALFEVEHRNIMIKAIADVEPLAVGRDCRGRGRGAQAGDDLAGGRVDSSTTLAAAAQAT